MNEELEPAAHIAEKSDYDIELVWNTEDSGTRTIEDSLYSASDIIQMIKDRIQKKTSKGIADGLDEAVIDELYEIKSEFQRQEVEE